MKQIHVVGCRGWTFRQLLVASLAGAAAGAALLWMTVPGGPKRRRVGHRLRQGRAEVEAVPQALRRATHAAREAFVRSIEDQVRDI